MRKLLLSIFLLALIAGVSYLKLQQQDRRSDEVYAASRGEVASQLAQQDSLIDSLNLTIADLTTNKASGMTFGDGLSKTVTTDQKRKTVSLSKYAPVKPSVSPTLVKPNSTESRAQEILAFYKKKYKELPGDLSTYEKRVAVAEVREEAARKYSITVNELDRLRERYKVTY